VPSGYKHLAPSGAKARPFRTSDGTAAKLNLKMSKEEPLHHSGICPNCPADTDQRFLYKADERSGKYREAGKVLLYGRVEILSLFCCVGCGAILVYKTFLEDIVDVDNPNLHDPKWLFNLASYEFLRDSFLIYSTLKKEHLHPSTPEDVRQ
jgi:hypothetical protein